MGESTEATEASLHVRLAGEGSALGGQLERIVAFLRLPGEALFPVFWRMVELPKLNGFHNGFGGGSCRFLFFLFF